MLGLADVVDFLDCDPMVEFGEKFWIGFALFSVLYWVGWESDIRYSWIFQAVFVGAFISYFRMGIVGMYRTRLLGRDLLKNL